ncbi:MAG: CinA family protein [Parabacteroides sp.]
MKIEESIGTLLRARQMRMGTAESCTGGRIASRITSIPGSSDYFAGGIVSYCNQVKQQVLGVDRQDLEHFGAVSEPVVRQMAEGAMRVLLCDCAVATSGIAGPGGGTPEKPVGTVWIAAAVRHHTVTRCLHLSGDRKSIIEQSADTVLSLLYQLLNDEKIS